MRVTDKMNQTQVVNHIQKGRSELANLQNQAATGKRITKPSDDPTASAKILSNRTEGRNLEQFDKGIINAKSFLESTESALAQLTESLVRAKELSIQAANDTNGGSSREMIAIEMDQIYNSVVEMSNRRVGEKYLFGGHQITTQPFSHDGQYSGDDGEIKIAANKGHFIAMNLTGDKVFMGRGIGHDGTIRPSVDTPQDVEQLQDYKISETERQFQNEATNDNHIETRGPASVGRIQRLSDHDPVSGGAGVNIFNIIRNIEVSMRTNDKVGIQESLEPLDQALNQINLARAEVGGRVNQLNASSDGIQKTLLENKMTNSQLEEADLFQVMTDLNKADTTLKGSLETSNKLLSMSLLDFIK
ncbi:MAG: flagellar hook-associated protein FlgL [Pseudobdellovibrio sp.]